MKVSVFCSSCASQTMSGKDGKTVMAGPATRSKSKNEDVAATCEEIKDGTTSADENEETNENPTTDEVPTKRRKTDSAAGEDSSIEPGSKGKQTGNASPIEVIPIAESSDDDDDDGDDHYDDDEDTMEVQVEIDEKTGEYVAYTRDPNAPLPPPPSTLYLTDVQSLFQQQLNSPTRVYLQWPIYIVGHGLGSQSGYGYLSQK